MPPTKQRMRQRFGPSQDYLLVVQVNTDQPFRAPYGGLMAGWEKVATTLNGCSAFKMHHLKGPIAKNRFERLVGRHREWVKNGSHPGDAPSQDASFQSVMAELIPKLDAAEAEPPSQNLGKRGRPRKIRPEDGPAEKKPALQASQVAIAPSPLGPQPSSSSTSLLVDSEDQALPIVTKATRQRFTPGDDLLLVKYVKESLPFRAKFGAISSAWEDVANKLDNSPDFSKDNIKGPIVRYRFENLVSKYRERVKRNSGRVVGPKGAPAGELEVLMTELVTLLDGGDPVSAALLAQNVAIATGAVNAVAERENQRTATSQDEDSSSSTSEPSSPVPAPASAATQSFITPTSEPEPASSASSSAPPKTLKTAAISAVLNDIDPSNIAELKALLQEMVEQQARATEQMLLQQREERRLEAERRERELEVEREEREKDRQALTATVMSAMKTFLEQNGRKD
ncbi:hypothetical protein PHYSODRAFT_560624 [Phytophthora sojae]|uniref:Myb-like domain-containing protein n=1 Tax=Phytophthora sojae (strain P6497) TaxID=1094619 RepID=G4ZNF6_PHYSP|nr:hypothetical protein PHYSODRAFT_560624 [Phytophthora sojae]EGZ16092.1 hypothetical protein PHYSODRAFT_560624 [Phytophthora sojae]|eukprot:XP_009529841.1 hypothetical protein PHYSODRAFT_560624 [Phytophthora sojae]